MKQFNIKAILMATFMTAASTVVALAAGSSSKSYDLTGFSRISVSGALTVHYSVGGTYSVKAYGTEDDLSKLECETNGDILNLRINGSKGTGTHKFLGFTITNTSNAHFNITIEVTSPNLTAFAISGASRSEIKGINCDEFSIDCSGASKVEMPAAQIQRLKLMLSGTSRADLHVAGEKASVSCSGASNCDLEYNGKEVSVNCSGASKIEFEGSFDKAYGDCSGASRVELNGAPKQTDIRCSGASRAY